jgi:hypothetical protein
MISFLIGLSRKSHPASSNQYCWHYPRDRRDSIRVLDQNEQVRRPQKRPTHTLKVSSTTPPDLALAPSPSISIDPSVARLPVTTFSRKALSKPAFKPALAAPVARLFMPSPTPRLAVVGAVPALPFILSDRILLGCVTGWATRAGMGCRGHGYGLDISHPQETTTREVGCAGWRPSFVLLLLLRRRRHLLNGV